jgi:hypothetical protein
MSIICVSRSFDFDTAVAFVVMVVLFCIYKAPLYINDKQIMLCKSVHYNNIMVFSPLTKIVEVQDSVSKLALGKIKII